MKAIILKRPGSTDNFEYRDIPVPAISADEVLIKVHSISINPVDIKTMRGQGVFIYANLDRDRELIIGWDISGTVTASKSGAFKEGDEVFGLINFPGVGAAYAEYVAVPASQLALKPANISHEEAAAATLAALTAWQNIVHRANVKAGDRVLIHSAAGGVGHYAIQIAKHLGAYVIGTSSAANRDFVLSLGADEHIDYKTQQLSTAVKDIDFVLDGLDTESLLRSLDVIKPGGKLIGILKPMTDEVQVKAVVKSVSYEFTSVRSSGDDMKQLAGLLQSGAVKSHVSKRYAFEDMAAAYLQIETGRTVGKVVINL